MKITTSIKEINEGRKYPYFGIYTKDNSCYIVRFIEKGTGIIMHKDGCFLNDTTIGNLFEISDGFTESCFSLFIGQITININP